MPSYKFIITKDLETKNELIKMGFKEIPSSNIDDYMFINEENNLFFENVDNTKITFSNKLFF